MKIVDHSLIGEDNVFRYPFTTSAFETDPHFHARLSFYFGVVQELAAMHSAAVKLSLPETLRFGKTWVILRTRMHVSRYATWPEVVSGETWVQQPKGLHFMRSFRGLDEDGKTLFEGESQWAYIDYANNRPLRPSEVMDDFPAPKDDDLVHQIPLEIPRRQESAEGAKVVAGYEPTIQLTDTDGNHHVNNLAYVRWITESLPHAFLMAYKVDDIDVAWLKQTYLDEHIQVKALAVEEDPFHQDETKLYFQIIRTEKDGSESVVFTAVSHWVKRSLVTEEGLYTV